MDLNLDNYSLDELINLFSISKTENITINVLQTCLYNKIELINQIDDKDLPDTRSQLIEFYTKCLFKLLNNIAVINNNIAVNSSNSSNNNTNDENNTSTSSKNVKLLPKMPENKVVQETNHFIAKHQDQAVINTFNTNLKSGIINPLLRRSFKKFLNINTRFRDNYSSTESTNFSINLPSTIRKVVSMKLVNCELPQTVYTISDKLGSNSFKIDDIPIIIPNGGYTTDTIMKAINDKLSSTTNSALKSKKIKLTYNPNNGLMTFKQTQTPPNSDGFILDFNFNDTNCPQLSSNIGKEQLTLGWLLGFRGNYQYSAKSKQINNFNALYKVKEQQPPPTIYTGQSEYTAESIYDSIGNKYFLLSVNDYQNNYNTIFISPFKNQSLADNNIIAKITATCCNKSCIEYPERIYFGPTDIAKLQIILYDENGRIIDINNTDYSFTLELEVIYDL